MLENEDVVIKCTLKYAFYLFIFNEQKITGICQRFLYVESFLIKHDVKICQDERLLT